MQTTEILGLKIATEAEKTRHIKQDKRTEHEVFVESAKSFFSNLETIDRSNMTLEEKIDLLLDGFIHLGKSLANVENLIYDNLGNPYK